MTDIMRLIVLSHKITSNQFFNVVCSRPCAATTACECACAPAAPEAKAERIELHPVKDEPPGKVARVEINHVEQQIDEQWQARMKTVHQYQRGL
jgi:hypothetical protein